MGYNTKGDDNNKVDNTNYPRKITRYVVAAWLFGAASGLMYGYEIGISGGVTCMGPFLSKFFPEVDQSGNLRYCKFDSNILTFFTSCFYMAVLVAFFSTLWLVKKCGRRNCMILSGLIFFIGAMLNAFAGKLWILIVGRILLGIGAGFGVQSLPLYVSGTAACFYNLSMMVGILIANFINFTTSEMKDGWRYSLVGGGIIAFFIIISAYFNSDSRFSDRERQIAVAFLSGKIEIGVSGVMKDLSKWYAILVVLCICSAVACYAWSWGPLGWVVASEIFPLDICSAAQSITMAVGMLVYIFFAQFFLKMLCGMKYWLFVFFACFVAIMSVYVALFLPETKNIPREEMSQVWEEHWVPILKKSFIKKNKKAIRYWHPPLADSWAAITKRTGNVPISLVGAQHKLNGHAVKGKQHSLVEKAVGAAPLFQLSLSFHSFLL
ncbi:sugar transport protein 12-like [Cornus florida]|uniref:sugar transport protein 12-like n=1 Tax=Cornus florida TaxID=4283 RepID=UPI0028A091CB|nr:sugar transport protein 12-like [Cornus florida]